MRKAGTALLRAMTFMFILPCFAAKAAPAAPAMLQQVKDTLISGTVTDNSDGTPVPGVTVKVPHSSTGVTTNEKGRYTLKVPGNTSALIFSSIGYKTQEVAVLNGQTRIDIALERDVSSINEVQVVAYGVQKKESVVGAISTVKVKDLKTAAPRSLANALAGKVAGIISVQRSGEPGRDDAQFWIRDS